MGLLAGVSDVNSECPNGHLPLYLAIIGGDILKIEALTDAGADASALHSDGNPLLYHAILAGYLEVEYLISGGADVNAKDVDGNPVLYHAIVHPRGLNIVYALIGAGVDVNAKDAEGNTMLSAAVEMDNLNVIEALIDAGASAQ